ncbi:MAG: hypothetical protein N2115_06345 [bacterium]|nr:hypothetical protein [bacterium]
MYNKNFIEIEKAIEQLNEIINQILWLRTWEFQQVPAEGEDAIFDEKSWKTVKDPSWATGEGTAFLRYRFVVPAEIEGMDIAGCDVKIEFIFPSGVELFVDDVLIYSQKYWADARTEPITIVKNAVPGSVHTLLFKIPKGDGHGGMYAVLHIEQAENILFELSAIRYQMLFAMEIAKEKKSSLLEKAVQSAISIINASDIIKRNWKKVLEQIKIAEEILEPFRKYAKKINVHLIGHAHIDMNWLWNYDETKEVCVRDFKSVTSLMDEFPELTFSQSQSHVYKIVEEERPDLFQKVVHRIKEKRWEVTANAWVENDLNMSCGESIARHIIYSRKYAEEKLKRLSPVMWCPDTFGHPATMPTVCADAGIKYYFHMRGGNDYPLYRWKGPDGKEIICYKAVYNNWIHPERLIPPLLKFRKLLPEVTEVMFPYGVGDHGGGPTRRDYAMKLKMEKKPVIPNLVFSTAERYFKVVEKFRSKLPLVTGEMNTMFEGCYTTHSDIKNINRMCEDNLLALEVAMALFSIKNGHSDINDINKLAEFWQNTLFNQFHDILCGSAIKSAYQYSVKLGENVVSEAKKMLEKYLKLLSPEFSKNSIKIFNPCFWETTAIVKIPSSDKWTLVEKLPACGVITKSIEQLPEKSQKTVDQKSQDTWETEFYILDIDTDTGTIKTLYDKENKRLVLSNASPAMPEDPKSWWAETSGNLISIHQEQPHRMSAWIIGNILKTEYLYEIEAKEVFVEPFRTIINIRRKYKNSTIIQKTILYPDFPFIDFETIIDWHEIGGSKEGVPMVRTNFSFAMENPATYYEIPFGYVQRPGKNKECPALRWTAMKEKHYWAGIIAKNRHGFNALGNRLSLTLLRNAYEPDTQSDTGKHEISYRLVYGKLNPLEMTKLASEFTLPPIVIESDSKEGEYFSPFEIEGNVLPCVLKPSIDGKSVIVRIVEMLGKKQPFTIKFNKKPHNLYLSNLAEENGLKLQVKEKLKMTIPVYGIITLKIGYLNHFHT